MKTFCFVWLLNPYGFESQKKNYMFSDYSVLGIAPLFELRRVCTQLREQHFYLLSCNDIIEIIYTHFC